jgi:hypothetical protein
MRCDVVDVHGEADDPLTLAGHAERMLPQEGPRGVAPCPLVIQPLPRLALPPERARRPCACRAVYRTRLEFWALRTHARTRTGRRHLLRRLVRVVSDYDEASGECRIGYGRDLIQGRASLPQRRRTGDVLPGDGCTDEYE